MIGKSANTAPEGAGTPVKNRPDNGVLMFSISWVLNLASRKLMQTAKNAEIIQPSLPRFDKLYIYIDIAGHTPKTAKSDKESSSAPKRLHESKILASLPSVASKKAAPMTAMTAYSQFPVNANRICVIPTRSADKVAKLGTIFFKDIS